MHLMFLDTSTNEDMDGKMVQIILNNIFKAIMLISCSFFPTIGYFSTNMFYLKSPMYSM